MPALLQLEAHVQVQVLQDGVGGGHLPTEPALGGALQVVLALDMQVCLKQVVHDYEAHLQPNSIRLQQHCCHTDKWQMHFI